MTSFDALLIAVFAVSIFFAAIRGATRELGTLISVLLAGLVAWVSLKPVLGVFGASGSFIAGAIAVALVSAVSFVIFQVVASKLTARFAPTGSARRFDRIGGGVFGFIRALLLLGLAYLGYGFYLDEASRPESVKNALLLPLLDGTANLIESLAPDASEPANEQETGAGDGSPDGSPDGAKGQNEASARETGYNRQDRASLSELVTTVTTTEETIDRTDAAKALSADVADPIAEILESDGVAPNRDRTDEGDR